MKTRRFLFWMAAPTWALMGSGCGNVKVVATTFKATPGPKLPKPTPRKPLAGEIVSKQVPDLVVSDLKVYGSRLGQSVSGTVTNHGTRTYDTLELDMDFLDAKGKVADHAKAFGNYLDPGAKWYFNMNIPEEGERPRVAILLGH